MTTFFEHQRLSYRKNYMRNLIQLASSDGHLDAEEVKALYIIGRQKKLKDWQIEDLLMDRSPFTVFIPATFHNRMNLLYDLMRLLYADGIVDEHEVEYVKDVLSAFNLSVTVFSELLILFKEGAPSAEAWKEFTDSVNTEAVHQKFLTIL